MMNIEIQKKHLYILAGLMTAFAMVFLVYAYGGSDPSVHGHDGGEMKGFE